ncbi:hypothetical protein LZQ00_11480 [Sphingobacterium sp. SRCM116780]|uniref:hypothetical protein n=1 Tax=Sphingobacterium sp. SRCM116780 TaxID=2907623 RepID=UPI001F48D653|nr:hypothetical protein [Sphingobacterium sp. SRCM116780]UIR54899.1 hypothetical protein LZQ00_11480 [Sphingobacterium sp. SRCM116780]
MTRISLIRRRFLKSLKCGTGEAYLIAKKNPEIDFSDEIIQGALNNYAYHGQVEGDRAQYIYDLIVISNQKEKIRKAVLNGLATETEDTWNLTHLFAITKLFSEQDDVEAKQAIYNRFLQNPIASSDWAGYDEILQLDGFDGLLFIAKKFGKLLEQNPDDWQDDSIIRQFQEENPNIKVQEDLLKASKTDKYIRIYLDSVKENQEIRKKYKPKTIQYHNIVDEVINSKPYMTARRRKKLTKEEVNEIAKQLTIETDNTKIAKLLNIFIFHKFPYDSTLILKFAQQKQSFNYKIVQYATEALQHLESDNIRTFALEQINNSKNPIDYLQILISNYRVGDHKMLTDIAKKTRSGFKIEQLAIIFSDIFKANKTKACKEPIEVLYSKMNCAIHRKELIEILIENSALSKKIIQEIQFDSYLETRQLHEEIKNSLQ